MYLDARLFSFLANSLRQQLLSFWILSIYPKACSKKEMVEQTNFNQWALQNYDQGND